MSSHQKKYPFDFKTQYGLGFNQQDDEIVVDFFCGGGGAGTRTYRPRHGAGRQELRRRRSEVAWIINSKPAGGGQHYPQSDYERYGPARSANDL